MLIQRLSTVSCRYLGVAIFANNVRKYLLCYLTLMVSIICLITMRRKLKAERECDKVQLP